jgi:polar amino acid transport system permease protein
MTESRREPGVIPWTTRLKQLPWWLLILLFLGVALIYAIISLPNYNDAYLFIVPGLDITVFVSVFAFAIALLIGLIVGLGRVSSNPIAYNLATFYVEVVRGIPMIVIIIYVAYVLVPLVVSASNGLGALIMRTSWLSFLSGLGNRMVLMDITNVNMLARAIAGLAFGYGAYEAEIFRAGIQSIERGQIEAARSLGMTYFQAMRYVILPQAIRVVLPPLGNDVIAMIKDSSLISVLAVRDLTQLGKLNRSRTFRTFETWNTVTYLYLSMTILGSMVVKWLEREMKTGLNTLRQVPVLFEQWVRVARPDESFFEQQAPETGHLVITIGLVTYVLVAAVAVLLIGQFLGYGLILKPSIGLLFILGGVVLSWVSFYVVSGSQFVVARAFGGGGSFLNQSYLQSLFVVPVAIVRMLAGLLAVLVATILGRASPAVAIYTTAAVGLLLGAYAIVLHIRTLRTVHGLSFRKAVGVFVVALVGPGALVGLFIWLLSNLGLLGTIRDWIASLL